jgi:RNase P/RNase MRP subunit p30
MAAKRSGYYDLNVTLTKHLPNQWDALLEQLIANEYRHVAINAIFQDRLPNDATSQFPLLGAEAKNVSASSGNTVKIYRRVTIVLATSAGNSGLSQGATSSLQRPSHAVADIVAIQPTNEKTFQLACQALDADIITLQMTEKLPFYLRKPLVHLAMQRGIFFELNYSDLLTNDASQKRDVLSNWMNLLSVTQGKNIVVSSGIQLEHATMKKSPKILLRGPVELMNMLTCLQCPANLARHAFLQNPTALLFHAATRKYTFKSILSIEPKCLPRLKNANLPPAKKIKLQTGERSDETDHFATDFISFEK